MPRARVEIHREKVQRAKAQIIRLERALSDARESSRSVLLRAHEAGMTQSQLASEWGTSMARMRDYLTRAKSSKGVDNGS